MAIGKPRGNKRPPPGSCPSTISTAVLVTVCVLGVWMLTSNPAASPSNTTVPINTSYDVSSFLNSNRKIRIDAVGDKLAVPLSNVSVSEDNKDNESDLPRGVAVAVEPRDDELKTIEDQETGQNDSVAEIETEPEEQRASNVIDDDAESLNDSDVGKQEAEEQEEQEIEMSASVLEDNADETKQKASSKEESKQKTEKIEVTDDQQSDTENENDNDKQTETSNEDEIREIEDTQEQEIRQITNQEQKTAVEIQKEQEHEEDGPIESHSIAAETKARVENQEARDVKHKMEQAKIESIIGNTTIPMKPLNVESSTVTKDNVNGYTDSYKWELCNVTAGTEYIPCLDYKTATRNLYRYENQERQCPNEPPVCLVPLPKDYKIPIPWPQSRDKIWLHNMPNKALSEFKGNQNWVKVTGEFITFPKGAHHYINFLQKAVPEIAWGKHTRVVLDVGCGVGSFGGYLFDKDVLTMSLASKDDKESQIQFALERGAPAISAVMATQRLPFPSRAFDLIHCVRCKVPWHKDGGILLLEANRLLRPGGYFIWSATPVFGTQEEDLRIWKEMSALTVAMCWELVIIKKDKLNAIGVAVYHKLDSNQCHNVIRRQQPPVCKPDDNPDFAWYVPLQTCMHLMPMRETERGSHWPEEWPGRVQEPPYWLNKSEIGIYGKPAPKDFTQDYEHWKQVIKKEHMNNLGINWSNVRNVMDMRAVYGGFAAALKDLKLWVLNVVNVDSPDTLPMIFERGLIGIYHDWCESFSTYPRTYDLLHADRLFSSVKKRCRIKAVMAEIDRILRPGGVLIARDEPSMISEVEKLLNSLDWEVKLTSVNKHEQIISGRKSVWRPNTYVTST